jgi:hypothetical protein
MLEILAGKGERVTSHERRFVPQGFYMEVMSRAKGGILNGIVDDETRPAVPTVDGLVISNIVIFSVSVACLLLSCDGRLLQL